MNLGDFLVVDPISWFVSELKGTSYSPAEALVTSVQHTSGILTL